MIFIREFVHTHEIPPELNACQSTQMGVRMNKSAVNAKRKMSRDVICVNVAGYILVGLFALICVLPFYLVIIASFTDEQSMIRNGYPVLLDLKNASIEAYQLCLKNPGSILKAYGVTTSATIVGTFLAVLMATMTGYVLSRKDFPW